MKAKTISIPISDLQTTTLFQKMTAEEIEATLTALDAKEKYYEKNETVLFAGSKTDSLGLLLSGSVTIESSNIWGNRTILSHIGKNEFFAETYALLSDEPMLVDVIANEDTAILFLRIGSLKELAESTAVWKTKLMTNLLAICVQKNLHLSKRNFHTSPKTIRERVLSYLNTVSLEKGKLQFDIPFDRQQLADYLNVERSALSKELGKMQREGLIKTRKRHFQLSYRFPPR